MLIAFSVVAFVTKCGNQQLMGVGCKGPEVSGVTVVGARGELRPPDKLNIKTGPPFVDVLIFNIM